MAELIPSEQISDEPPHPVPGTIYRALVAVDVHGNAYLVSGDASVCYYEIEFRHGELDWRNLPVGTGLYLLEVEYVQRVFSGERGEDIDAYFTVVKEREIEVEEEELPEEVEGGTLQIGMLSNGEVCINHPDLKPDEKGVGHIVFSPAQARECAKLLNRHANSGEQLQRELRSSAS